MCCFSQPVISVSATNIFARAGAGDRQFLAYSMSIQSRYDLAMILPMPVKTGAAEKDVQFIDLKGYPEFFADLRSGFPAVLTNPPAAASGRAMGVPSAARLEVVQVGEFEASFVPTVKDFSRLDARFRLLAGTWKELPGYQTYGFAVFKLKPGAMTVHPMAFSFPRLDTANLFFPTVHIHDGKVHPKAGFDHELYCQPHDDNYPAFGGDWEESHGNAGGFMRVARTKGLIESEQHCYKRELHGQLPNRDTFLKLNG